MDNVDEGFQLVDQAINDALEQLGSARMRKAMREVAQYLRRENKFRIDRQKNVNGTAYKPRKKPKLSLRRVSFEYEGRRRIAYVIKETSEYITGTFDGDNAFNFSKDKISGLSKVKVKKGKMMKGFARNMQAKWTTDTARISIGGKLSKTHHFGKKVSGIKYPSRTLIGLPEKDKQEVLRILIRNLELDKI